MTITATAKDASGKKASCTVNAIVPVKSITINPPCCNPMIVGEKQFLSATVLPSNASNKNVEWKSLNPTVAAVNSCSGHVIANSAGTATIYATQDGSGVVGCLTLCVENPILVKNIELSACSLSMERGKTTKLCASIYPENATNKRAEWSSTNGAVACVSDSGYITAKTAGTTFIRYTAQDGSGVYGECMVKVKQTIFDSAEETPKNKNKKNIEIYDGAYTTVNTLMNLFGGQNLKIIAGYNSTNLARGIFGIGWYHNYEKRLEVCNRNAYVYISPSIYSKYEATDSACKTFICKSANRNGYVLTVDCTKAYPYVIDCNSDHMEYYDSCGRLAKIVNHQGFKTTIEYTSSLVTITDSVSGKKMYLEKNANGLVEKVYDDVNRQTILTYANKLLTSICDANGNCISYAYDEDGRILSVTDAKGIRRIENIYDEYGRVIKQKDAVNQAEFKYDGTKRISTNRNGDQSTYIYYAVNGLLNRYTDENGNTHSYEYDARFNMISETDGEGNSIRRTYNSFNKPTKVTDQDGNVTRYEYDCAGNVTKITYPAVHDVSATETFAYNSRNQLLRHTDARGTTTSYVYDTNGMLSGKQTGSRPAAQYVYQNGLLMSETDALGHTTKYAYNEIGQKISQTDADGKVTKYTYDQLGNPFTIIDANGKTISFTYDGNYQKLSVTDANGNVTRYAYNGNMKNTKMTLPDGNHIRYAYDSEDRLIKVIDQKGQSTVIQYDAGGRKTQQRTADGAVTRYEYDAADRLTKEINPKGAVTSNRYDRTGNVIFTTDHADNTTWYAYDARSRLFQVNNALGGAICYTYSPAGDLLSEEDPWGNTKSYTYDAYGNRLTATDAKGNVTTYTYDANNNLLTLTNALGQVTTYTYDSLNRLVSAKDQNGNIIRYGYDALGRRTSVTDARGNVFRTTYDANGNVIKTTDTKGNTISETTYNALNLPTCVIDAAGKATTYTYTALGKVETITDPMNHQQTYAYDALGRNTSVLDAAGNTSSVTYDLLGNITKLSGPKGGSTSYTYDDMGRLTSETTASNGMVSYTYNELNLKAGLTNARGQKRTFIYDIIGRIVASAGPEGTVNYTYDANGNVSTVKDSNGTVKREFDALNRVTKYTDTYGKTIRYEYDQVGNLSKMTYPDNTSVTYTYDENHNLLTVTDWAGRMTKYTYDVNNRVIGMRKPDGSTTETKYDSKQRITSTVEKTAFGTIISGFAYTYDALNRLIEEKLLANDTKLCYTYDTLNRVTKRTVKSADNEVLSEETYAYDAASNLTDAPDSCFLYDVNNRLTNFKGQAVSYDMDGNMLSAPLTGAATSFTYDSANRLLSAGGHTYTYNAENVRIRNLCDGYDTKYTYNANGRLSQLLMKTTNGIVTKYVYGRGLIGEEKQCEGFKTYHFDLRGSTVAITDEDGKITDTFAYDTYGNLIARTGDSFVIFGYNGRDGVVTDKNGLIYMRARYYAPKFRRFVNADIVTGKISNAVTLNRYAYANGNPVSNIDPFGAASESAENSEKRKVTSYNEARTLLLAGLIDSLDDVIIEKPKGTFFSDELSSSIVSKRKPDSEPQENEDDGVVDLDAYYEALQVMLPMMNNVKDVAELMNVWEGYVKFVPKGNYLIIKGDRAYLAKNGITQTRIRADNIPKFPGIANMSKPTAIFKSNFKGSFQTPFIAIDIVSIGAETIYEMGRYDDLDDQLIIGGYNIATGVIEIVASSAVSAGAMAGTTAVCAAIGTAYMPVIGTAIGLIFGLIVGSALDYGFDYYEENHLRDYLLSN